MNFIKNLLIYCLTFVIFSEVTNAQDEYCTEPFNPIVICYTPDVDYNEADYELYSLASAFGCATNIISNECFRYMPLPGFYGSDTIQVSATDILNNFQTTVIVHVADEDCENITVTANQQAILLNPSSTEALTMKITFILLWVIL